MGRRTPNRAGVLELGEPRDQGFKGGRGSAGGGKGDPPRTDHPYRRVGRAAAVAAHRRGCSSSVVYDWIKTGKLAARRGTGNRLCMPWT